jgi:hypothetical protein
MKRLINRVVVTREEPAFAAALGFARNIDEKNEARK